MLKKFTIILCVMFLALSFAGCDNGFSYDDETGKSVSTEQVSTTRDYEDWGPKW